MKFFIIYLLLLSNLSFAFSSEVPAKSWEVWDSAEGKSRLQTSQAKEPFWKLIRFYESQPNLKYCGVATAVVALNTLSVEAPPSKNLGKFRMFTQEEFFTETVSAVMTKDEVEARGLSLEELSSVLRTFPIKVRTFEALSLTHEEMRPLMTSALNNPKQLLLVLYSRRTLDQEGGGHWSPIAAYDEHSDSFLVMDVARFKYPPVWVEASTLMNAMQTVNDFGRSRGFLILEK